MSSSHKKVAAAASAHAARTPTKTAARPAAASPTRGSSSGASSSMSPQAASRSLQQQQTPLSPRSTAAASSSVPTSQQQQQQQRPPSTVSVLMCAYNSAAFIREAVDSILQQTLKNFEFVIVEDGSTDDTRAILKAYAAKDPRIRLHFHSRNQGLVSSLTTGLALVTGSLVARMDADDISHPERLALQVAYMDQHSDVEVLGTAVEVFRSEGFTGAPSAAAAATEAPATAATAAAAAGDEKPLLTRTASHVLYTEARSTVERASHTLRNDAGSEPAPPLAQSRAHRLDAATASTEAWTARSLARPASSRVITHPSGPALVSWTLNFFCPLAHPSVMVRSATLRGLSGGAYQPGWVDVEDLELWQRASRAGVKMDNLSRVLLRLRKHGGNVSSADASAEASSPSNTASLSASAVPASPSSPSSASASSSSAAAAAASPSHAALSRSAPLQKLHAVLATSVHMSLVTRAAVSADFAYALMHPCAATLPSVDHVATALRLLLALERAALHPPQAGGIGTVSRGEFEAIKLDATSRMGELVTLAMMSGGGGGKTGSSVPSSPSNSSQAASSSSPPPATAAASSMAPAAAASPASPRAASSSSSLPSASAAPAPLSALAALQLSALGSSRAEAASSTCFSLPTPGSSATALWRQWMGRGADSATLLAKLLGKS